MNDAQRWRDAMHALGLEWRVGMVDTDGAVCVPWDDGLGFVDCVNGDAPINHIGGTEDIAIGSGGVEYTWPDPHHPSNLGHLVAMVCEVYGVTAVPIWSEGWHVEDWGDPGLRTLGRGDTLAEAWLDALERKAREGEQ